MKKGYRLRDAVLLELGFSSYREYLKSDLWFQIKRRVFAVKGRKCSICGRPAYAVHHNRYKLPDLLGERLKFLEPICNDCHQEIEFSPRGHKLGPHHVKGRFKILRRQVRGEIYRFADLILNFDAEEPPSYEQLPNAKPNR